MVPRKFFLQVSCVCAGPTICARETSSWTIACCLDNGRGHGDIGRRRRRRHRATERTSLFASRRRTSRCLLFPYLSSYQRRSSRLYLRCLRGVAVDLTRRAGVAILGLEGVHGGWCCHLATTRLPLLRRGLPSRCLRASACSEVGALFMVPSLLAIQADAAVENQGPSGGSGGYPGRFPSIWCHHHQSCRRPARLVGN